MSYPYPWLHLNLNKLSVDIIIASVNTLYTPPTVPSLFLNSEAGPGIETDSVSRVQLSAQHSPDFTQLRHNHTISRDKSM